jgi:hypothetical protein
VNSTGPQRFGASRRHQHSTPIIGIALKTSADSAGMLFQKDRGGALHRDRGHNREQPRYEARRGRIAKNRRARADDNAIAGGWS